VWRAVGRRPRRALVGLLRFGRSDGARNDRDVGCPRVRRPLTAAKYSPALFLAAPLTLRFPQWSYLRFGRGAASTKYAALSSLGNVPVVYLTALDGWVDDRFGTGWMLQTDALSAILFVVVAPFVLHKINAARAQDLARGQQSYRLELRERRDS
jgi:hypothetical protein